MPGGWMAAAAGDLRAITRHGRPPSGDVCPEMHLQGRFPATRHPTAAHGCQVIDLGGAFRDTGELRCTRKSGNRPTLPPVSSFATTMRRVAARCRSPLASQ